MTLLLAESFDGYGPTTTDMPPVADGKWDDANNACMVVTGGAHGFYGRRSDASTGVILQKTLASADEDDVLVFGGALFLAAAATGVDLLVFAGDAGATTHLTVKTNSTSAKFEVWRGPAGSGTLLGTAEPAYVLSAWQYLEVKVKLHDSAGTVDIRVDETSVLALSGIDTKNAGTDTVFDTVRISGASNNIRWDDVYLCNEQGATNNGFLGAVVVECLGPSGNGNSSQFVGSDGNSTDNYLLIDDGADGNSISDLDYVESDTDNNKDTYAFDNSAYASPQSIYGVVAYARARRSDTGARTLALVARSGASETDSADFAIPTSSEAFTWVGHAYETKPGGGSWTFTDLNAAEFGVKARP